TAGVSFDVLAVSLSSPDFNALLGVPSFQAVAAPYNPTATPLPAALPLFATGLGVLGLFGGRRKREAPALAACRKKKIFFRKDGRGAVFLFFCTLRMSAFGTKGTCRDRLANVRFRG